MYSGIVVCERHLLSPVAAPAAVAATGRPAAAQARPPIADAKYLRSVDMRTVDVIDQKLRTRAINPQQAYDQLFDLVTKERAHDAPDNP